VAPIKVAIAELAQNPRPHNHIKLTNFEAYRIRVGNYRVIPEINDNVLLVTVVEIADRKQVGVQKIVNHLFHAQRRPHNGRVIVPVQLCDSGHIGRTLFG
jgi:hypothetical protein